MSKVVNGIIIIQQTPNSKCELCETIAELRPYGANNENICVNCGMKDEEMILSKIKEHLFDKAISINRNNN